MPRLEIVADFDLAIHDEAGPEDGVLPYSRARVIIRSNVLARGKTECDRVKDPRTLPEGTRAKLDQENPPNFSFFIFTG